MHPIIIISAECKFVLKTYKKNKKHNYEDI